VAKSTIPDLWDRHIVDSVQAFLPSQPTPRRWLDIGSGGGLPGMVIACMLQEKSPQTDIHFIESDLRKSVFLRTALRELSLTATVHAKRIQDVPALNADVISARALADLPTLISLAYPHLAVDGECLFPKGKTWGKEVDDATKQWKFNLKPITSITNPDAVVLRIRGISVVGATHE
jgi:16S rRNA (guanine527-N7)-methyltransferase